MSDRFRNALAGCAAGLCLALGACATTSSGGGRGRGVEVTRFHLDQPIAPGEVAVEPFDPRMAGSLEYRDYAQAVDAELRGLGFRPAPTLGASELVATVDVRRGSREQIRRLGGLSIGIGGGGFGYRGGVGGEVGATVPVGGGVRQIVGSELAVQLKRRSDGTVIWEGRARGEAPATAPAAAPVPMVQRLAHALFAGFPGESGRTIVVR